MIVSRYGTNITAMEVTEIRCARHAQIPHASPVGRNMDMYDLFGKMMLEGRAQIGIAKNAESRRRRYR